MFNIRSPIYGFTAPGTIHGRLSERIQTAAGDFFRDPLPKADVITMGMILHDWNLTKKKHLIKAAYNALSENGVLIAVENIIDDQRRENAFWPTDVAQHVDRVRRCVRFQRCRLLELVQRSRIQELRSAPLGRPLQRGDRVQEG